MKESIGRKEVKHSLQKKMLNSFLYFYGPFGFYENQENKMKNINLPKLSSNSKQIIEHQKEKIRVVLPRLSNNSNPPTKSKNHD